MSETETDLKIRLSEARTDTKFAELMGRMDAGFAALRSEIALVNGRLDHIEKSTAGLRATVVVTAVAVVGVLVAIMGYGQTWFGIGVSTRDVVRATVSEYVLQHPQSAAQASKP